MPPTIPPQTATENQPFSLNVPAFTDPDYTDYNAALLGRSLGTAIKPKKANEGETWDAGFGSFHEKITLPDGLIDGSGHQLWSAAAFLNVCIRAGLVT